MISLYNLYQTCSSVKYHVIITIWNLFIYICVYLFTLFSIVNFIYIQVDSVYVYIYIHLHRGEMQCESATRETIINLVMGSYQAQRQVPTINFARWCLLRGINCPSGRMSGISIGNSILIDKSIQRDLLYR